MNNMKKTLCVLLAAVMMICVFPISPAKAATVSSGECGNSVTWSIDENYTLTINGTGEMADYYSYNDLYAPWYSERGKIKTLVIEDGITKIGDQAFLYCTNLTTVTISESVTEIGFMAFSHCERLKAIEIPNSVVKIDDSVFSHCFSLESIEIPESVTDLGFNTFGYCKSLKNVVLHDGIEGIYYSTFNECKSLESINIPESVMYIGEYAFSNCESLKEVTIPGNVATIEYYAFYNCSVLTDLTVLDGVSSIREKAFADCVKLENITLPDSLSSVYIDAFQNTAYYNDESNWDNGVLYIDNCLIESKKTASGDYDIKDGTVLVADCAFMECSEITGFSIPDSVKNIGAYAFSDTGYYNDESNWDDDVLYIENYLIATKGTLSGKYDIKSGTTHICDVAFVSLKELTEVTMPDSVVAIGESAFYDCVKLENVSFSENLKRISDGAFESCNLKKITIPESVTEIGSCAFYYCINLSDVTFNEGLESIESEAFFDCRSLLSVTLPNSLTYIGAYAFGYMTDENDNDIKTPGFKLYGYNDSVAEEYAPENELEFVSLGDFHVHSYQPQVTTPATCTENGVLTYICSCQDSYTEVIEATGHSYSSWKTAVKATCNKSGQKKRVCSGCGDTVYGSIPALGHSFSSKWTIDEESTCDTTGTKSHHCTRCSVIKDVTTVPAKGHAYGSWKTTKKATCTSKGTQERVCSTCGNIEKRSKNALGHNYSTKWTVDKKATCTSSGSKSHHCTRCTSKTDVTKIAATGHDYKLASTQKATTMKSGSFLMKCSACEKTKSVRIPWVKYVKLSTTVYTYDGKVKKPTVTVKDATENTLIEGTDYTVKYQSGRKNVGQYTVTVTFKGNYSGSKTLKFKINPKGTTLSKLTADKGKFTANWNKQTTQVSGYQLQYSTSSKMTDATRRTVSGASTTSKTISGLKSGTRYYVQIRTYKTVNGVNYYSDWSKTLSVKTK